MVGAETVTEVCVLDDPPLLSVAVTLMLNVPDWLGSQVTLPALLPVHPPGSPRQVKESPPDPPDVVATSARESPCAKFVGDATR